MNRFIQLSIVLVICSTVNCIQNRHPKPDQKYEDVRGEPPVFDPDGPRSVSRTGYYGQYCNVCGGTPLCKTVQDCLDYNEDWGDHSEGFKSCVSIARAVFCFLNLMFFLSGFLPLGQYFDQRRWYGRKDWRM